MKARLFSILAALILGLASFAHAQTDMINLDQAQIVNAPDVRSWAKTATITQMSFNEGQTRVEFTKKDGPSRWPDVTPAGWTGPLQYTLWLFVKVDGQWVGSAFIQFWHGRSGSGSANDPDLPSLYDQHWYYSPRWRPINGHGAIHAGEQIGFMVTSGNQRDSVGPNSVAERSNTVTLFAADSGAVDFTDTPVEPPMPPLPPPTPTPVPPGQLEARVATLEALVDQARLDLFDVLSRVKAANDNVQALANQVNDRLKVLESKVIPTSCSVQAIGVRFACRLN